MIRRAGERGLVAIEFVVLIPVVILIATMAMQIGVAGWTATQTERAARDGARALSLGENVTAAASSSLPGILSIDQISTPGSETVRLRVKVPRVSVLPQSTVTREVTLPRTSS